MKALLLSPSVTKPLRSEGLATTEGFEIDDNIGHYPPLGLLYIAAAVDATGRHQSEVVDMGLEKLTAMDIPDLLEKHQPDIVGITALTFNLIDSLNIARAIKATSSNLPVVFGGPHAHIFPSETLGLPNVDYVFVGEGEGSFPHFLDVLSRGGDLNSVPGLCFRSGLGVVQVPHEAIENIDEIPFPARRKTHYKRYRALMTKGAIHTTMMTSRGCPFKCSYCDRPQMGRSFRAHSPDYVLAEIDDCLSMGINGIAFFDDTMTLDRERVRQICEGILRNKMKIHWNARTRVDCLDENLLGLMSKAGCRYIAFGIESAQPHVLKALKKGTNLEKINSAVSAARRAGMKIQLDFMLGNPEENRADILKTIEFARSLPAHYAQFSITTPFPGTPMYTDFIGLHPELGDYWRAFANNPTSDFRTPVWAQFEYSPEELSVLWRHAMRRFYLRPSRVLHELATTTSAQDLVKKGKIGLKTLFGGSSTKNIHSDVKASA